MSTDEPDSESRPVGQYHMTRDVDAQDVESDGQNVGGDVNELTYPTAHNHVSEWREYFEREGYPDSFRVAPFHTDPVGESFGEDALEGMTSKSERHSAPYARIHFESSSRTIEHLVLFGAGGSDEADRLNNFINYEVERGDVGYMELFEAWVEWIQDGRGRLD